MQRACRRSHWAIAVLVVLGLAAAAGATAATDANEYTVTNLQSTASDATLVNGWGLAALAGSPWWVSDNGTNAATLYRADGSKQALTVAVKNAPLDGLNRAAGYLFQAEALFPWKTATENVAIGLEIAGTAKTEARARAQQWLGRVGLGTFGDRYPHMLSGGQRKRVGLVQVLIRDPKILLMDEPFGPLDAQTRQIMGNLLLDLWSADRKAVLFVTHDLEEAIALSDRVVIMSAGPAARIIGDWKVPLARPRDIGEVKLDRAFHALHREIWEMLKDEVMKGYAQTGGG